MTVCLRPLRLGSENTDSMAVISAADENSNHVEATVTLPLKTTSPAVNPSAADINQLRRLRKKRVAAVALDTDGGKRSRDAEDFWF